MTTSSLDAILESLVILAMGLYRVWHGQLLRSLLPPLIAVGLLTIGSSKYFAAILCKVPGPIALALWHLYSNGYRCCAVLSPASSSARFLDSMRLVRLSGLRSWVRTLAFL